MTRSSRWRETPKTLFSLAVTKNRDLHLTILALFADRDLSSPALTLEEIMVHLGPLAADLLPSEDTIRNSLDQLVEWSLLDESRNESAIYSSPEEFQLRNVQWALTGNGQAAVAGLDRVADFLAAVASLQPAAIDSLAQAIGEAVTLAHDPASSDASIHVQWLQAEHHHQSLVDNVRQFQRKMATLLRDPKLDDAVLAQARDTIIEYLTRYIQDAEQPTARVAEALSRVHTLGPDTLFERARLGANLAPDPTLGDPGPAYLAERHVRLRALDTWFYRTEGGSAPQMARLRGQGRDWVLEFLRVLELRRAHQRKSAGIIDDFIKLAAAFATCHVDDDAHRLFSAAFALHGARHHTLPYDEVDSLDPMLPADANPTLTLSPSLRARSRNHTKVREKPVPKLDARRADAAREQVALAHERRLLREALVREGAVPLSSYGTLDPRQFSELLDLLCAAITTHAQSSGVQECISSDGRVIVTVQEPRTPRPARLRTTHGVLTAPDFLIAIRVRSPSAARPR